MEYYDIEGKKHQEIFEGFESTVLSHEIDHLNGILHIDIALKIKVLTKEERKELRKKEPYQIIRKEKEYTPANQKINTKLITKFIKSFPIYQGKKENPYIILLDGYTGMGKTTVAKAIAKQDNSIILNNDEVRMFLNDYQDTTNLKNRLQKYRLERLLLNKNSCICDSCLAHNYQEKIKYYKKLGLNAIVKYVPEEKQEMYIIQLLSKYRPDILVITGHDGMIKKGRFFNDIYNYINSRYFVNTVRRAREWDSRKELVIFAGACQSYYEALMSAGANFASSPARVLIDFADPLIVAEKIAITDNNYYVTINDIADELRDGKDGVGGVGARGKSKKITIM